MGDKGPVLCRGVSNISDKVYDAASFLLRKYSGKLPELDDRSPVVVLLARGFTLEEINLAFDYLFLGPEANLGKADGDVESFHRRSVRVLSATERLKLDYGAQGLLHMLSMSGLLSTEDMESLLQLALSSDAVEVSAAELIRHVRNVFGEGSPAGIMTNDIMGSRADTGVLVH